MYWYIVMVKDHLSIFDFYKYLRMKNSKQTFITAFALFSMFFGVGNLILPPYLGFNAGSDWVLVTLGFAISAVIIPIMAIYAHAKLQGTIMDFGLKVSSLFALIFSLIIYIISIALPAPRTASLTYEIAVQPYFEVSSLWSSTVYFILVLIFVLNRQKILDLIGKYLTPLIIFLLFIIIILGLFDEVEFIRASVFNNSFTEGILEGYQTFDAIGGVVVGGVIVISLTIRKEFDFMEKRGIIVKAGIISGLGLLIIYGGLIALGAHFSGSFNIDNRTELLQTLSINTLGSMGAAFLSVLVSLACFTTAVGILAGTADFFKGLANNSDWAFRITAVIGCFLGVLVGQFDIHYIIDVALPVLMFIYPITIVLILLNAIPEKWASNMVFRAVVITAFIFSIPDFLSFFINEEYLNTIREVIPFSKNNMGWVIPSILIFILVNMIRLLSFYRSK
jgi:LIVCS family branched-chain amino acid:cation transporter